MKHWLVQIIIVLLSISLGSNKALSNTEAGEKLCFKAAGNFLSLDVTARFNFFRSIHTQSQVLDEITQELKKGIHELQKLNQRKSQVGPFSIVVKGMTDRRLKDLDRVTSELKQLKKEIYTAMFGSTRQFLKSDDPKFAKLGKLGVLLGLQQEAQAITKDLTVFISNVNQLKRDIPKLQKAGISISTHMLNKDLVSLRNKIGPFRTEVSKTLNWERWSDIEPLGDTTDLFASYQYFEQVHLDDNLNQLQLLMVYLHIVLKEISNQSKKLEIVLDGKIRSEADDEFQDFICKAISICKKCTSICF
ncbi:MAG: hypothetical protein ISR65_06810 [Bacteriovoracaceae bacterium]|nr:hypothetical protein [Bacteriovoracaceae bacterium]